MQLTGKQIVEAGIISNYCEEAIQQQGVDVRLEKIYELTGIGYIPETGSTQKCDVAEISAIKNENDRDVYTLSPGYYEVLLKESCKLPNNVELDYKTRSSLVRCGATVHSGQFDAGFETERMGCFLHVRRPIHIERGARIAQVTVNETYPVSDENLYNGQWQKDKQRTVKRTRKRVRPEEVTDQPEEN